MMPKNYLFGKKQDELEKIVQLLNLPAYHGRQIAEWLYKKEVSTISEMTNLSKTVRTLLSKEYEMGLLKFLKVQESIDETKKYLFETISGKFIETAYIPEKNRSTLCVSSQVGCKMGCLFCMTGKQGFQGQLSVGEILSQLKSLPERKQITNIVYMGMGEPFDNLKNVMDSLEILTSDWGFAMSPRRITVSTIGIIPGMKDFLENSKCHLAVSLNSPFEEERKQLMPVEKVYSLPKVLDVIKSFDFGKQRRVSFEYIMLKGFNDTKRHVNELVRLLHGIRCRVNLIRFHPIPGTPLESSDFSTIQEFQNALKAKGIITTLRASRGQDIAAACGLLSTEELVKG